jgi:hypothetical protein
MSTVPLTPTEQECLLATLHACGPDAPRWQLEPPEAGDRGLILGEPEGMRLLIEVPVVTPERLQVTGLFPVSPEGHAYLPYTQATPAITVARARGMQALTTAIVRRLLPVYQPLWQTAQARDRKHRDALARQASVATVLAQVPGCVRWQAPGQVGIAGMGLEASTVSGQATVTLEGDITLTLRGLSPQAAYTLLTALHLTPRHGQGEGACHDAHR